MLKRNLKLIIGTFISFVVVFFSIMESENYIWVNMFYGKPVMEDLQYGKIGIMDVVSNIQIDVTLMCAKLLAIFIIIYILVASIKLDADKVEVLNENCWLRFAKIVGIAELLMILASVASIGIMKLLSCIQWVNYIHIKCYIWSSLLLVGVCTIYLIVVVLIFILFGNKKKGIVSNEEV